MSISEERTSKRHRAASEEQGLPTSAWRFVCGEQNEFGLSLKFRLKGDTISTNFTSPEEYMGFPGKLHGGIAATVLDEAMGWAVTAQIHLWTVTTELSVRYRKAIPIGRELRVEARAVDVKRRLKYAVAKLFDDEGVLLASAEGAYYPLSAAESRDIDKRMIYRESDTRLIHGGDEAHSGHNGI